MAKFKVEVEGLAELERQFRKLDKFPKRKINQSANAGMKPVLAEARSLAPKGKTGLLKKGINKVLEKTKNRSKGVYKLTWKEYEAFIKPISKEGQGIYGGTKNTGYYPVSVNFGFKGKGGYVQGRHFLEEALRNKQAVSAKIIVDRLGKEVDKLLQ